ncbi:uncharacterized protein [Physcomitrium patens]|uniref:uncharacterized protein n=1 Tax=Physcomitrium patens TaxID=3218 RepID=UPI003CCD71B4
MHGPTQPSSSLPPSLPAGWALFALGCSPDRVNSSNIPPPPPPAPPPSALSDRGRRWSGLHPGSIVGLFCFLSVLVRRYRVWALRASRSIVQSLARRKGIHSGKRGLCRPPPFRVDGPFLDLVFVIGSVLRVYVTIFSSEFLSPVDCRIFLSICSIFPTVSLL